MKIGLRRLVAWLIDWICILCWAAVTAAVGVPLYLAGVIASVGLLASNAVGAVVIVVPVVLAAAYLESRPSGATPGKRAMGISVRSSSGRPTAGAALLRNSVKIGLPWLIGHSAVYALVANAESSDSVPPPVLMLTAAAYLLPLVWVGSLFVGSGRTPYDRLAGTSVLRNLSLPR